MWKFKEGNHQEVLFLEQVHGFIFSVCIVIVNHHKYEEIKKASKPAGVAHA